MPRCDERWCGRAAAWCADAAAALVIALGSAALAADVAGLGAAWALVDVVAVVAVAALLPPGAVAAQAALAVAASGAALAWGRAPGGVGAWLVVAVAVAAAGGTAAGMAARLRDMATADALTGLPNRRSWDAAAAREVARASRTGEPLCVALLDVDGMGRHNAREGRAGGDALLERIGLHARLSVRLGDVAARLGPDELALLLPDCGPEEAESIVDGLRAAVSEQCTLSVGLVSWDGREVPDDLLRRAAGALRAAQRQGADHLVRAPSEPLAT